MLVVLGIALDIPFDEGAAEDDCGDDLAPEEGPVKLRELSGFTELGV